MSPFSMIEIEFDFPLLVMTPEGPAQTPGSRPGGAKGRFREPPFYPLPYRRADGAILYPARGRGRYFRDEAIEAMHWLDVMCAYLTLTSAATTCRRDAPIPVRAGSCP
jgi:hypothetical protein